MNETMPCLCLDVILHITTNICGSKNAETIHLCYVYVWQRPGRSRHEFGSNAAIMSPVAMFLVSQLSVLCYNCGTVVNGPMFFWQYYFPTDLQG